MRLIACALWVVFAFARPAAAQSPELSPALRAGLQARIACSDPDAYGLDAQAREACDKARSQSAVAQLGPDLPRAKQDAFDHAVACHEAAQRGPRDNDFMPTNAAAVGYEPNFRTCTPGSRN